MKENSKWYLKKINGEDFVYHCFIFKPAIQDHTFIGNEFIGMNFEKASDEYEILNRVIDAGKEGFLPDLLLELKNLIGENNFEYDGYEIGEDEFSHYFFIRASCYKKILLKIEKWRELSDLDELMFWEEKEL